MFDYRFRMNPEVAALVVKSAKFYQEANNGPFVRTPQAA